MNELIGLDIPHRWLNEDQPHFVTSRRGRKLIQIGRYTFGFQKHGGAKTRWMCSTHNSRGCKAVMHMVTVEVQ
ncbi:hypothetical protein MSG28_008205, partial [Choristoneura fumiferana]